MDWGKSGINGKNGWRRERKGRGPRKGRGLRKRRGNCSCDVICERRINIYFEWKIIK